MPPPLVLPMLMPPVPSGRHVQVPIFSSEPFRGMGGHRQRCPRRAAVVNATAVERACQPLQGVGDDGTTGNIVHSALPSVSSAKHLRGESALEALSGTKERAAHQPPLLLSHELQFQPCHGLAWQRCRQARMPLPCRELPPLRRVQVDHGHPGTTESEDASARLVEQELMSLPIAEQAKRIREAVASSVPLLPPISSALPSVESSPSPNPSVFAARRLMLKRDQKRVLTRGGLVQRKAFTTARQRMVLMGCIGTLMEQLSYQPTFADVRHHLLQSGWSHDDVCVLLNINKNDLQNLLIDVSRDLHLRKATKLLSGVPKSCKERVVDARNG